MHTKFLGYLAFMILICFCQSANEFKLKMGGDWSDVINDKLRYQNITAAIPEEHRGFLHGGLFSLGKVLNFFPVGGEKECQPTEFTIARAGICLNPYDCRQRDGKASGDCAHGLGVCCVFEVTCGGTIQNNLTYFMSPRFPELWTGEKNCTIEIEKTHAGIVQLRIDFVHFTIGQPNRTTGDCDEDAMVLGEGATNFTMCGQNHGQHKCDIVCQGARRSHKFCDITCYNFNVEYVVPTDTGLDVEQAMMLKNNATWYVYHAVYYTLGGASETSEAGDLPRTPPTKLAVRMRGSDAPRLWLMRVAQMPLAHSSPHDCLQYQTENNGTIQTFNYATNGRHLAAQEYRVCVRRNVGFCAIRYTPCDDRSFRIGPRGDDDLDTSSIVQMEQTMPTNGEENQEDEEGSGVEPHIVETSTPAPGLMARIWSFIWPFREQRSFWGWSPYVQHYSEEKLKYYGYGNYLGKGFGRLRCTDRVTIPCENEYFVTFFGPGVCDPHHCGNTLCPGAPPQDCRVDTSITPFAVSVHFGPPTKKQNPEENIGMCLRYTQVPCDS